MDFAALAKSFSFEVATKVQRADDIGSSIERALDSNAPALVEVPITQDVSVAGAEVVGWWDFPVLPIASAAVKADYKAGYACEQHRFHCRIKHATNQCAERQQCVSRVLLHAEARYGPTV